MSALSSGADEALIIASGLFDGAWYLERNPGVKAAGMDPLLHYLRFGACEGRNPSPDFDAWWYLSQYPDVAAAKVNPLVHFIRFGAAEGRLAKFQINGAALATALRGTTQPIIAYEAHNLKLQGAPSSLFEIASGVALRGSFKPVVMASAEGPIGDVCRTEGVPVLIHDFPQRGIRDAHDHEQYLDTLANAYKSLNISLVHANTLQTFYAILGAHRAGIPSVWNIRESEHPDSYFDYLPQDLRDMAYECFSLAGRTVFVAEATRAVWKSFADLGRPVVIPNALKLSRLTRPVAGRERTAVRHSLAIRDDDILVLSVGSVTERKGQLDLVGALGCLDYDVRQRLVVAIIGFSDNAYSTQVREGLQRLEAKCIRTRAIAETTTELESTIVAEYYLAANIFVLCSRLESYPRVILEAMAFGLPIIATPCFGITEQTVDGESALHYRPGDMQAISLYISQLTRDPSFCRQIGRAAHNRLLSLNSYDEMLESYEDVYRALITTGNK